MRTRRTLAVAALCGMALASGQPLASACTGISLQSQDGGVIAARTVEWALGDAKHNQIVIFPRGKTYRAQTPDGLNGMAWTGRYGLVSVAAYDQPYGPDAMNEKGLYVGAYYFPGYADFKPYDRRDADRSMSVAQVRANLDKVQVVDVKDPRFGGVPLPSTGRSPMQQVPALLSRSSMVVSSRSTTPSKV